MGKAPSRRATFVAIVVLMLAASCGVDNDPATSIAEPGSTSAPVDPIPTTSSLPTSTAVRPTTTVAAPEEGVVCGHVLAAGFSTVQCDDMSFDVAVTDTCLDGSCGLIVDLHGFSASGGEAEAHTAMQELGNAAGYAVVQPNSPGVGWDYPVDSVSIRHFLDQLIDAIDLDANRVHIGGHSAGGHMTWVLVCDHADLIASAAPLGAGASDVSCGFDAAGSPSEEVDILLFHGRSDPMVPFGTALYQRDRVVARWAMTESAVLADEPTYRWTQWINPEGTVFELLEFDWEGGALGNHCYPGAAAEVGCGSATPVHYGEAALQFYIDHPKNE